MRNAVRQYFDAIAPTYSAKYTSGHVYHHYFFQERLSAATFERDFEGKTLLDIGAGTGALYDYIAAKFGNLQYFATDISEVMLSQSNIPPDCRFIGSIHEITLPLPQFDYIFLLGVTSYMSREELLETMAFIEKKLAPSGTAILSFTHRCSLDFQVRRLFRTFKLTKLIKLTRSRVIAQSFATTAYCLKDLEPILTQHCFFIHHLEWLNQTVTPFNHLLPGLSVRLAQWLKRTLPGKWLATFSGDFLITVRKIG